jgi:hypothetical protein
MLPSIFSLSPPANGYQWLFAIYCYAMPILLYGAWAAVSLMDMFDSPQSRAPVGWGLAVLLIPLAGGAAYLLARATSLDDEVASGDGVVGLLVWLFRWQSVCSRAACWGPRR